MPHAVAAFVLQGNSDFNALTGFTDELCRCLNGMNIEPVRINLTDWKQSLERINQTLNSYPLHQIVGAFSFSGFGIELGNEQPDGNIWQQVKIPVITWMLDHPAYILQRHAFHVPVLARLYTSKDFIDFKTKYVKTPGRTIHARFGALTQGRIAERREPKKGEKPLIILPKKLANVESFKAKWQQLPVLLQRVIHDAVDHYWGDTGRGEGVAPSVLAAAQASGLELQCDLPLLCYLIAQLDQYFRHLKTHLLVSEVLKLPIRVYGNDANDHELAGTKAEWLPSIDYGDLMNEYRKALAVISMNPNVSDGCHDRNYSAFGVGALPISDTNPWWEENFPELQSYSYNFKDKSVTSVIEGVLADPYSAAEMAWSVGNRVRTERPFEKVVEEAVECAIMQRYFEFEFVSDPVGFIRSDLSLKDSVRLMKWS